MLVLVSCAKENGDDKKTVLNLGHDTTILDNASISLSANVEGKSYKWSNGANTKSITIEDEGQYWLEVTFDDDSKQTDTITIKTAWRMVSIETQFGNILLWLHEETPLHKEAFLKLVNEAYFDDLTFNRVIDNFVIQGGCPDLEGGFTDTSLFIAPEFHEHLSHIGGALGGGRDNNPSKKTNACQFYIVDYSNNEPTRLDGDYTIFGMVAYGKETVEKISAVDTNRKDEPKEAIGLTVKMVTYTDAELLEMFGFERPRK